MRERVRASESDGEWTGEDRQLWTVRASKQTSAHNDMLTKTVLRTQKRKERKKEREKWILLWSEIEVDNVSAQSIVRNWPNYANSMENSMILIMLKSNLGIEGG